MKTNGTGGTKSINTARTRPGSRVVTPVYNCLLTRNRQNTFAKLMYTLRIHKHDQLSMSTL